MSQNQQVPTTENNRYMDTWTFGPTKLNTND